MNMKYIALLQLLIVSNLSVSQTGKSGFQTEEIFRTPEAKQGVAVDADERFRRIMGSGWQSLFYRSR